MNNGSRIRLAASLLAVLASGCASAPVEMTTASSVVAEEAAEPVEVAVLPERQFLLLIDYHSVDAAWDVEGRAARWNDLVGCDLLVLPEHMDLSVEYDRVDVRGVPGLERRGDTKWGYVSSDRSLVELNPRHGMHPKVTMHELGHVLGLSHHDGPGVMVPSFHDLTPDPSDAELAEVREMCP